jgi:dCTP deaminase
MDSAIVPDALPMEPQIIQPGILVDTDIMDALKRNYMRIDPFDQTALEPATYDLSLGSMAVVTTSGEPVDLSDEGLLKIPPYAAALVQTEEILTLSSRIVGRLGARSNLLQNGIIASTGPQIDPGFTGRIFVNLLNISDRPFSIRRRTRFLSAEFHLLAHEPSRIYEGPHQNKTQLSDDDINRMVARSGPSLKDVHHDLLEIREYLKDAAMFGRDLPRVSEEIRQYIDSKLGRLSHKIETVPMTTLATANLKLQRDIPIVIEETDGGFVATFFDANLSMSGDTQEEAFRNVRGLIVDILSDLEGEPFDRLGPGPRMQLQVLQSFVTRGQA